jgi:hypothetical protein
MGGMSPDQIQIGLVFLHVRGLSMISIRNSAVAVFISSLTLLPSLALGAVWNNTSTWSQAAENDYHQWVQANWDKNIFRAPGAWWDGNVVDCADTVYSMRLIYAAERGLPFAIKDPTGSGVISNQMKRFDNLPSGQRKRAFLQFIYDVGSTASLPNDTYPVAVNRNAIGPGRLLLTDARSHHSWTIKYVSSTGIPFLLFSSRPAKDVLFERFEYPSKEFTFIDGLSPERHAGFRAFRWPEDLTREEWEVPGYSLEQYQLPWANWASQVRARLQTKSETADDRVTRVLDQACRGSRERVDAVLEAQRYLLQSGNRCLSQSEFDDYSTPSRDSRLKSEFIEIQSTYKDIISKNTKVSSALFSKLKAVVSGGGDYCSFQIRPGKTINLGQALARGTRGYFSSNPMDTVDARWGFAYSPDGLAAQCPEY